MENIELKFLKIAKFHHRTIWGDLKALASSIEENGLIEPLVVRPMDGMFEIIAGARRYKAALSLSSSLSALPCIVHEMDDEDAIAIQAAENLCREGMHPIDEALYYEDLHRIGWDHAAIAKRLQVKKRDVVRRLRLLSLSPKARKAFADRKFDEEAAMALASTDDASKQADVIAALDAGALQPEDIAGYIQRTFTAQLEDVPWRLSDSELVPKAGSCNDCPKRSDKQRELFASKDGESRGIRCLDTDCHRDKMEAVWKKELGRPGVSVAPDSTDALFMPSIGRPTVVASSGMVDADAPCKYTPGRTWRESVFMEVDADDGPTVFLARDQDGRPRFLLREAVAARIVRKSDSAKAHAEAERAKDPVRPDVSPRNEAKVRRALILLLTEQVIAGNHDTWPWVAERIVEGATARAQSAVSALLEDEIREFGGMEASKDGLIALAQCSARHARRVATAILMFDEADVVGQIGAPISALAAACDIDIAALERELRKEQA